VRTADRMSSVPRIPRCLANLALGNCEACRACIVVTQLGVAWLLGNRWAKKNVYQTIGSSFFWCPQRRGGERFLRGRTHVYSNDLEKNYSKKDVYVYVMEARRDSRKTTDSFSPPYFCKFFFSFCY
jgi:hypothetical protein